MSQTYRWLVPALGFVLLTGALGVTIKLSLRHTNWTAILVWTAIVYAILALGAVLAGGASFYVGPGWPWAMTSGVCAAGGLICSFVALRNADAVVAVPVMSAYPVVTVIASLAVLSESISATKVVGMMLVLFGVLVLAR
jgi:bacterial/archaeal transporter family protein